MNVAFCRMHLFETDYECPNEVHAGPDVLTIPRYSRWNKVTVFLLAANTKALLFFEPYTSSLAPFYPRVGAGKSCKCSYGVDV